MKRILLLTGKPGVGKTTVFSRTIDCLKSKGYAVGGMISREVRSDGNRMGFEIQDLSDGKRGWLARVGQRQGPQIGRYHVDLDSLEHVGVSAISKAIVGCEIVAIDEIGPMELCSRAFKETVTKALQSGKLVIATVHWREKDSSILKLAKTEDVQVFEVTTSNREDVHELLAKEATKSLSKGACADPSTKDGQG